MLDLPRVENVHSLSFETEEFANAELQVVHRELYPEWADVTSRASRLQWVKELMSERRRYLGFEASSAVAKLVKIAPDKASSLCRPNSSYENAVPGFWNPGWNCCYLNAA